MKRKLSDRIWDVWVWIVVTVIVLLPVGILAGLVKLILMLFGVK